MITCPKCKHQEVDGALFCSECGAQLIASDKTLTHKIVTAEAIRNAREKKTALQTPPQTYSPSKLSLHLVESGQILPLADQAEFTLGRVSEGQPIVPDIDLSPYNAYPSGVSRLHAVIKIIEEKPNIVDLGSSNGTYLNGIRLDPHLEIPLEHGDIISLGKLKLQVLLSMPAQD